MLIAFSREASAYIVNIIYSLSKFFKIMEEITEKIYCRDRGDNDNALAAAILANGNNRRDDWGPMAAMMGGGMNN